MLGGIPTAYNSFHVITNLIIRSSYGNLTKSQGQLQWGKPIARIGQGNRAWPQIWVAVSLPLFQILLEDGFLAMVICALSLHKCNLTGFRFVENINLCITSPSNQIKDVAQRMQCSLRLWAGLLCAMGGALIPEKSHQPGLAKQRMEICQPQQSELATNPWWHWTVINNSTACHNRSPLDVGGALNSWWQQQWRDFIISSRWLNNDKHPWHWPR